MAGDGLYARVAARTSVLARRMIQTFLDELPVYRLLPREQLEGEITRICEENLRRFFATLSEDRAPTEDELAEPRASAARRAQERVPLDAVLAAYHVGARVGWGELCAEARRPEETEQLVDAAARVLRYIATVTGSVATAYLEERQSIHGEERDAARGLVAALLAGQETAALAARLGVQLASSYVVLVLEIGANADERTAGVAGAVAARRKVRRVQERLDAVCGQPVLGLLDATGGPVLLPAPVASLPRVVQDLQAAAGGDVRAGASEPVPPRALPQALAQAHDVLRLAVRLGRPPGLCTLADVLLEYQLTRPSAATDRIAALLEPLERNPDLLTTLDAYLAQDLDRRSTAAALHVHPNTLDYRLKRIVELTGLDPSTTTGLQLLASAAALRRVEET